MNHARQVAASEPAGMDPTHDANEPGGADPPMGTPSGIPVPAAGAQGIMKKKFRLFNTITHGKIPANLKMAIRSNPYNVQPEDLMYDVWPPNIPAQFDPRDPKMVPEARRKHWFYTAADGDLVSILSAALDQAACGSCWAYATASMFSDRVRFALLKRFGDSACVKSRFFDILEICTGESHVLEPSGGVVNPGKSGLYAVEVRDRISPYWVAAFSPKMRDTCPRVGFETCTYSECEAGLSRWKRAAALGGTITDVRTALGERFGTCLGCEGNHIAMPMLMFTGAGGPMYPGGACVSDFTNQDWVCLFGTPAMQKSFCRPALLNPKQSLPPPILYKADRYSYVSIEDFRLGYHPKQVHSMEEWIRTAVYDDGPVTIGFAVYQSFMDYYQANPKGVYQAKDFIAHIKASRKNDQPMGGHAVVIVGWGEVQEGAQLVKYWVVRNSWGADWGDGGFFRIERNMDWKLAASGYKQRIAFEDEWATVYFAPDPNPNLYPEIQTNPMTQFLKVTPSSSCGDNHLTTDEAKRKYASKCSCPGGYLMANNGKCVKDTQRVQEMLELGTSQKVLAASGVNKVVKVPPAIVAVLFIILVIVVAMVIARAIARARRRRKATGGCADESPPPAPVLVQN